MQPKILEKAQLYNEWQKWWNLRISQSDEIWDRPPIRLNDTNPVGRHSQVLLGALVSQEQPSGGWKCSKDRWSETFVQSPYALKWKQALFDFIWEIQPKKNHLTFLPRYFHQDREKWAVWVYPGKADLHPGLDDVAGENGYPQCNTPNSSTDHCFHRSWVS